ncbi:MULTISPECIES: hypothetical protein [unclassified Spirillospora]
MHRAKIISAHYPGACAGFPGRAVLETRPTVQDAIRELHDRRL